MRVRFISKDHVYHGSQSREGLAGTLSIDGGLAWFHPDAWGSRNGFPVLSLVQLSQLEAL